MKGETKYLLAGIAIGTALGAALMVAVLALGAFFLRSWSVRGVGSLQQELAERFEGSRAFDFEIEDINPDSPTHGESLQLSRLYPAKGVLVNFMASWCIPCLSELPGLEEIQASGLTRVVCVAASEPIGDDDLLAMAASLNLTLPLLRASPEQAEILRRSYAHEIIPCSYLIDGSGVIRKVIVGAMPREELEGEIRSALDGHVTVSATHPVETYPSTQTGR